MFTLWHSRMNVKSYNFLAGIGYPALCYMTAGSVTLGSAMTRDALLCNLIKE